MDRKWMTSSNRKWVKSRFERRKKVKKFFAATAANLHRSIAPSLYLHPWPSPSPSLHLHIAYSGLIAENTDRCAREALRASRRDGVHLHISISIYGHLNLYLYLHMMSIEGRSPTIRTGTRARPEGPRGEMESISMAAVGSIAVSISISMVYRWSIAEKRGCSAHSKCGGVLGRLVYFDFAFSLA